MGRRVKTGPVVFLFCIALTAGSCAPMRLCCRPQGTDLLATGIVGWQQIGGAQGDWRLENGVLSGRVSSSDARAGARWMATVEQYDDFELSLEFRIAPGADSGVFVRAPLRGDPTYAGMEIQILDDSTRDWGQLRPNQVCGSIYGVQAPSERMGGKAGQWQELVIRCRGSRIAVVLNGRKVVDAETTFYPYLYETHPGLTRQRGYIGLQHHSGVEFRNITIEPLGT
jgi:hypothetical protein